MAEFIRHDMPEDFDLVLCGDHHVGALAFREAAWLKVVEWIANRRVKIPRFWGHQGDIVEGKLIDSPHFNPESLRPKQTNIKQQADYWLDINKPIFPYLLWQTQGNHDRYLKRNFDVMEYVMKDRLDMYEVLGGPQTWVQLRPGLNLHSFHGRRSLPKGAKDPLQRPGNQKAWLKCELEQLAGDCVIMCMGHTHACIIVEPIEQYTLLSDPDEGGDVQGHFFVEPNAMLGESLYVPKESRWYVNTGTFRASGFFGAKHDKRGASDYAEEAGYRPMPTSYALAKVRGGQVVSIEKIIV